MSVVKYGISLTKHGLLLNLILSFVFYTSYFVFSLYIPRQFITAIDTRLVVQALFNFVVVTTLIVASFFIHRIDKLRAIYAFSLVTSVFAVLLFFVPVDIFRIVCLFVIAIFFSIGQLAFLMYFWNLTVSLLFYLVIYTGVAETLDFPRAVLLGTVLSSGALVIILLRPKKVVLTAKKDELRNYPEKRTILLYIIPWILFCLINATLAKNISFHISQQVPASSYLSSLFCRLLELFSER